jgi:FlaA1/EpsC-like NDP-sugar epimerase
VQRPTNSADNIHRDEALVAAARRYVDASRRRMSRIDKALRADLGDRDDVILWGAGQLSMKLLRDTVLATKRIAAIVDSSPQRHGMHVGSTEIVAPTALRELPPFPIVITSIHSDEAIAQTIERRMALPHQAIRLYRAAPN